MRTLKPFVAFVAIALLGAACSSGGSDDTAEGERSRNAAPTEEAPAVDDTADDLTSGQVDLDAGAPQPDDPAASEAEIRENFVKYFDSETPQEEAFALAEDAEDIAETLLAAQEVSAVDGHRTVEVTDVSFTDVDEALVTFSILVDGQVLLEGFVGNVVVDDGVWKVARSTNCQLAGLAGVQCPPAEG